MRITFGTLSWCAWLGDVEAVSVLNLLTQYRLAGTALIYYHQRHGFQLSLCEIQQEVLP